MNRHALTVLQYDAVLDIVAGRAASAPGAEAVRALVPSDVPGPVREALLRVDEMLGLLRRSDDWHVPPVPDLRAALRRLGVAGAIWDGRELRDAATLLESGRTARRTLLEQADAFPLLAAIARDLFRSPETEDVLRRAIDETGAVRDEASRELGRIRREMRGARARIVQQLERYMASLPARFQVPDASVTVRDGRFVIPVRREARAEVGGIVHDESATGLTLFVEPPVALELMNRLRALEHAEVREVQRILRELTDLLRPDRAALAASLDALIALDSLNARARWAHETDGHRPELVERGVFRVVHGRHPLLLAGPEPVVPFDLLLEPAERTLLVSGPNTGGKTVLLKAIGLFSALAQAGIIPPVGPGTVLPMFDDIYADIGDEQSIEASLSTFSAHLKNLREILDRATPRSLVLIDEIGSGTDPAEGAALARAILVELTHRGTLTVATTHLGELKRLATEEPGVVNASLQFDAAELRPTYRLLKGVPGRSYGLAIAGRLGFPAPLLERAAAYQPASERDAAVLLQELAAKERQAAEALAEAQADRQQALELRSRVEQREQEVRQREREAERRARQQARDILLAARREVDEAIRQVREAARGGDAAAQEAAFRAARRRVEDGARAQAVRKPEARPAAGARVAESIEAGARVRVAATGVEGTVVEVRDGRALVELGGVRLQVPLDGLERGVAASAPPVRRRPRGGWHGPDIDAASEIDLRGLRAEEVAARLAPALDAAILAALPSLRIIHGKGTGALREVVAELLRADGRVGAFRPGGLGEGGAGVTVAELA
jgi:DNA mismatch repair protein MutS2